MLDWGAAGIQCLFGSGLCLFLFAAGQNRTERHAEGHSQRPTSSGVTPDSRGQAFTRYYGSIVATIEVDAQVSLFFPNKGFRLRPRQRGKVVNVFGAMGAEAHMLVAPHRGPRDRTR